MGAGVKIVKIVMVDDGYTVEMDWLVFAVLVMAMVL
jgi:hypothetical protein